QDDYLAGHIIVAGAENRLSMLEKSMYDSWASRIRLFIKGNKNDRMMLDSIDNGPLSKFVTDVKLAKSLYTTNYDQLYAYLNQHEQQANEVGSLMYPPPQQFTPVYAVHIHHQHHHTPVNPQQQSVSLQSFISSPVTLQSQAGFPQLDSGLVVPTFQQGEDPINCINKAITLLFAMASRFSPSNNQLITSSNPINQETIQAGRVTVQQVQRRQTHSFAGIRNRGIATTSRGNYAAGQEKIVKCYNYPREGNMAK
nr:hypothetical protein [Tanacetum cinerariifolium]